MNLYAIISILASFICVLLANFIYYYNPKNRLNQLISILAFLAGFLAFVEFCYRQAETIHTAYLWIKVSMLWPFVPALMLNIALTFRAKFEFHENKLKYLLIYLPAIVLSTLGIGTNLVFDNAVMEYYGWTYNIPADATFFALMSFWTILWALIATIIFFSYYKNSKEDMERKQAKYIFIGLYVPLILSLVSDIIFPIFWQKVPEMTMTTIPIGLAIIAYGMWKYQFPVLTPSMVADKIINTMSNILIILDHNKRIFKINPAVSILLGYAEEELYQSLVKTNPDSIVKTDIKGNIIYVSPQTVLIHGYQSEEELIGRSIFELFAPEAREKVHKNMTQTLKEGFTRNLEYIMLKKSGTTFIGELNTAVIRDMDQHPIAVIATSRDITHHKETEKKIKDSLEEKEILLKEIHHRVKNNLQIISSLLNLQSRYVDDQETEILLRESQNRVKSMAIIHEKLYQSPDLAHINFREYIYSLLNGLLGSYALNTDIIRPKIELKDFFLDLNIAIPLGLIVNEMVINSIKHAFPDGSHGEITVKMNLKENNYILTVSDNGVGLSEYLEPGNVLTLGFKLIYSLSNQIDGSLEVFRNEGTEFRLTFPRGS